MDEAIFQRTGAGSVHALAQHTSRMCLRDRDHEIFKTVLPPALTPVYTTEPVLAGGGIPTVFEPQFPGIIIQAITFLERGDGVVPRYMAWYAD
jgi:hypothetical protein